MDKLRGVIDTNALLIQLPNVEKIEINFRWNLIPDDPDDNKFVDAAIAGRVKYIVSNDKHFNILTEIKFPIVEVMRIEEFIKDLKQP